MPDAFLTNLTDVWQALFLCCLIALTKNYDVFIHNKKYGNLDVKNFITGYIGIPLYLMLIFGYKYWFKTKGVPPEEADLFTGKDEIDRQEAEEVAREDLRSESQRQRGWFYKKFVSWLF
jgi:amino acid transporter